MPTFAENLAIAGESIRVHKLRAALTVLGLTMGVATLITVMTIVQGANVYVEQKVANLGINVFQIARTPFAVIDFSAVIKALRNKNIAVIPLSTFLRIRGSRQSLTLQIKASGGRQIFEEAQDEARLALRASRHIRMGQQEDFFIGTADSYITLWESISSGLFAVFVMVSSISAVVGGIVIMNVMLVAVTERTKEIGVRRAVGATQGDILRQFLTESVMQCLIGGFVGIAFGFGCALAQGPLRADGARHRYRSHLSNLGRRHNRRPQQPHQGPHHLHRLAAVHHQ